MKVLHVPYGFYPDAVGGTEVYVEALARELQSRGVESIIAAPGYENVAYDYQGIPVRRYKVQPAPQDLRDLYSEGDADAARSFSGILSREQPDIVHLHAFSRGASLRVVRAAKAHDSKVIFTYHTPTVTCQRGTMMKWGTKPCDGFMETHTCSRCNLQELFRSTTVKSIRSGRLQETTAKIMAHLVGSLPSTAGARLGQFNLSGGPWTALRMTELLQVRHEAVSSLFAEVDHVVAVCEWVKRVIVRNGVPLDKITLCRQGVSEPTGPWDLSTWHRSNDASLNIAFFGRLDPTKGIEIIIRALGYIPTVALRLCIYGVAQGQEGREYELYLRDLAVSDPRVEFNAAVPVADIPQILRGFDLVAVPSQWLETGPLVVLEAFAAGVPIIGSRLGGIAELVRDRIDGILIEPSNVQDWASTLRHCAENPKLVNQLRNNVRRPRHMSTVAAEMFVLYERLLEQRADRRPSTTAV